MKILSIHDILTKVYENLRSDYYLSINEIEGVYKEPLEMKGDLTINNKSKRIPIKYKALAFRVSDLKDIKVVIYGDSDNFKNNLGLIFFCREKLKESEFNNSLIRDIFQNLEDDRITDKFSYIFYDSQQGISEFKIISYEPKENKKVGIIKPIKFEKKEKSILRKEDDNKIITDMIIEVKSFLDPNFKQDLSYLEELTDLRNQEIILSDLLKRDN